MRLRLILMAPLLLLLVVFALSNTVVVPIGLWPTGISVATPLSVAILIAMALAFLAGALLVWFGSFAHRLRARRAEARVSTLEAELDRLRAHPAPPPR